MKAFAFYLDDKVYVIYNGKTLGEAISAFLKDGLHDINEVVRIKEEEGSAIAR